MTTGLTVVQVGSSNWDWNSREVRAHNLEVIAETTKSVRSLSQRAGDGELKATG